MRVASGMSRTIDPRRPRQLTDSQQKEIEKHPEVRLLRRARDAVAKEIRARHGTIVHAQGAAIHTTYLKAQGLYKAKKRRVERAMLADLKRAYKRDRPLADISLQLKSPLSNDNAAAVAAPRVKQCLSLARQLVVDRLFAFAADTSEDESRRRVLAISAIIDLSQRQEGRLGKAAASKRQPPRTPSRTLWTSSKPVGHSNQVQAPLYPIQCEPTQCIFCLGQTALPEERRTMIFHSRGTLKRHWENCHLKHLVASEPLQCPHPECDARLLHTNHLRNHAHTVHMTPT